MPEDNELHGVSLGWWTISGDELMSMLKRVAEGETPEMVYTEAYANSEVTDYGESGAEQQ